MSPAEPEGGDTVNPETAQTEGGDTSGPDGGDTSGPDSGDTAKPETARPDTPKPDAAAPNTTTPDGGDTVDTSALERSQEAIDEGNEAAQDALGDDAPMTDLEVPAAGRDAENTDQDVTPRPS